MLFFFFRELIINFDKYLEDHVLAEGLVDEFPNLASTYIELTCVDETSMPGALGKALPQEELREALQTEIFRSQKAMEVS